MITVSFNFSGTPRPVGFLSSLKNKNYFEFHPDFLANPLPLSPLKLPARAGVFSYMNALPGVFDDSLPDGWGRLILDRYLRTQGILPESLSCIDRLAYVGKRGMGALIYDPDFSFPEWDATSVDPDILQAHSEAAFNQDLAGSSSEVFEELLNLGGSSGGARPKALLAVSDDKKDVIFLPHNADPKNARSRDVAKNYQYWMIKFRNSSEPPDAGILEYIYSLMAKNAGIEMTDCYLFSGKNNGSYFGIQRFDRKNIDGMTHTQHLHSASGLLETDFRVPSLDYDQLMTLTAILTKDRNEVERLFRLTVFNVLGHNRDDHGKNFSFLMTENGKWRLSPAYDLTFSSGPRGQHSTMILGEGKNPHSLLTTLGKKHQIAEAKISEIIEQTKSAIADFSTLAKAYALSRSTTDLVLQRIVLSSPINHQSVRPV
jgi:serine/threonine-protein kinase HipA